MTEQVRATSPCVAEPRIAPSLWSSKAQENQPLASRLTMVAASRLARLNGGGGGGPVGLGSVAGLGNGISPCSPCRTRLPAAAIRPPPPSRKATPPARIARR